jgi:hypothetical protein
MRRDCGPVDHCDDTHRRGLGGHPLLFPAGHRFQLVEGVLPEGKIMSIFVQDIRNWWRWFSTWLTAASGTLLIAYENFPQLKDYVPDKWFHAIMGGMLVLIFLGRIVKQGQTDAPK